MPNTVPETKLVLTYLSKTNTCIIATFIKVVSISPLFCFAHLNFYNIACTTILFFYTTY